MSTKMFRALLTLSWVALLITLAVDAITLRFIPPELQEHIDYAAKQPPTALNVFLAIVHNLLGAALVVSYIGLYLLRSWGKRMFMLVIALDLLTAVFDMRPLIYTAATGGAYAVTYIIVGIVIAGMYFGGGVADVFRSTGPKRSEP